MALKDALQRNGLTPVEPKEGANPATTETKEGATGATEAGAAAAATPVELDDSQLLEALKKRGIEATTLDSLKKPPAEPTPEEKEAIEKTRREAVRKHGLQKQIVTSTLLEEYDAEIAETPAALAFKTWKAERLEEQAKLPEEDRMDEEELLEEFNTDFYQFADETDPKRLRKEKELKKLAESYLKTKYGKVIDLDQDYHSHVQEQELRSTYHSSVKDAIKGLGDTLPFTIKDGKDEFTYNVKLTPEDLATAEQQFSNDDSFAIFGKAKLGTPELINTIKAGITQKRLSDIIAHVATAHASARVLASDKGRRGIPVEESGTATTDNGATNRNPNMKKHLDKAKRGVQD